MTVLINIDFLVVVILGRQLHITDPELQSLTLIHVVLQVFCQLVRPVLDRTRLLRHLEDILIVRLFGVAQI